LVISNIFKINGGAKGRKETQNKETQSVASLQKNIKKNSYHNQVCQL